MKLYNIFKYIKDVKKKAKTIKFELHRKTGFWIFVFSFILGYSNSYYAIFGAILYGMMIVNRRTNVKESRMKIDAYDPNVPAYIDRIIDDAFNEYIVLNLGYKKDKVYLNSVAEEEMNTKMVDMVSARISDSMIEKLNAFYNEDMVPDIISSKIYMAVMSYVIENNSVEGDIPQPAK